MRTKRLLLPPLFSLFPSLPSTLLTWRATNGICSACRTVVPSGTNTVVTQILSRLAVRLRTRRPKLAEVALPALHVSG